MFYNPYELRCYYLRRSRISFILWDVISTGAPRWQSVPSNARSNQDVVVAEFEETFLFLSHMSPLQSVSVWRRWFVKPIFTSKMLYTFYTYRPAYHRYFQWKSFSLNWSNSVTNNTKERPFKLFTYLIIHSRFSVEFHLTDGTTD